MQQVDDSYEKRNKYEEIKSKKIMLGTSLLGLPFVSTASNFYCYICHKENGLSDFSYDYVPCPDAIDYFENNIQYIIVSGTHV